MGYGDLNGRGVKPPALPPTAKAVDPQDRPEPMVPTVAFAIMPKHVKVFWIVQALILAASAASAVYASWALAEAEACRRVVLLYCVK